VLLTSGNLGPNFTGGFLERIKEGALGLLVVSHPTGKSVEAGEKEIHDKPNLLASNPDGAPRLMLLFVL
jgi:hypothetical protein